MIQIYLEACGKRCGKYDHRTVDRDVATLPTIFGKRWATIDTLDEFPHLNLFWVEAFQGYYT